MEAHITTTRGTIKLNLFYDKAPVTVSNFVNLSNRGYYNNISFGKKYKYRLNPTQIGRKLLKMK